MSEPLPEESSKRHLTELRQESGDVSFTRDLSVPRPPTGSVFYLALLTQMLQTFFINAKAAV